MEQTPPRRSSYAGDVAAWASEQAELMRSGAFGQLDIEHIADELESLGRTEQRELADRLAVLLTHLSKWHVQPERQGASWLRTMKEQRRQIDRNMRQMPSLRPNLDDPSWLAGAWGDAVIAVIEATGKGDLPDACPWMVGDVLRDGWLP